mgnify:CR=1 FL=1
MLQINLTKAGQCALAFCLIMGLHACTNPESIPDAAPDATPVEAEETSTETIDDVDEEQSPTETQDTTESESPDETSAPEETDTTSPQDPLDDRVELVVFTESLCPCAAQWVWDLSEYVLPAVGDILKVERYLDGSANEDGSVSVFHGSSELRSQTYEVCVQHIADSLTGDGFLQSLAWTACINGECTGPGGTFGLEYCDHQGMLGEGEGTENAEACAAALELPWEEVHTCATGDLGQSLHWESSSFGNNNGVTYGMQGLPVVWLNGERISSFWDCNSYGTQMRPLISAICEAYQGSEKPEACVTD